ncbi:MAG: hypothetical protein KIH64_015080 [Mycobacterium sp.]|nr:hypothetical protein [Mycobacterium sp.]
MTPRLTANKRWQVVISSDEWIRGNDRIERVLADPEQRIRVEEIVALMRVEDEAEAGSE